MTGVAHDHILALSLTVQGRWLFASVPIAFASRPSLFESPASPDIPPCKTETQRVVEAHDGAGTREQPE